MAVIVLKKHIKRCLFFCKFNMLGKNLCLFLVHNYEPLLSVGWGYSRSDFCTKKEWDYSTVYSIESFKN